MADLWQKAKRRKQWATRLVLGALATTLVVVAVAYRRRTASQHTPRPSVPSLPEDVHQQLSGFTFTRSEGGKRVFTIHADRTLAFKEGGATVLNNVYVEFFGQDGGRHDILRTRHGKYYRSSGDFSTMADVEIELNAPPDDSSRPDAFHAKAGPSPPEHSSRQPVFLETSQVAYRHNGSLVETEAPVRFREGSVSGSAVGMTYATKDGWLELYKNVQALVNRGLGSGLFQTIHLSAARFRFNRNSREGEFWGPVVIRQGNRTSTAQHARVTLNGENRVIRATLDGQAKISETTAQGALVLRSDRMEGALNPSTEQLQTLIAEGDVRGESNRQGSESSFEANHLDVSFSGPRPESGRATGNVRLDVYSPAHAEPADSKSLLVGATTAPHQELTSHELLFKLRSGGRALESARTTGEGRLVIFPHGAKAGGRTVTAGRLLFTFDLGNHLEALRGTGGTRVEFMPPLDSRPGTPPSVTSAESLLAAFDPSTGNLSSAEQSGNFHFEQADRRATAEKARYSASDDTLILTGRPEVWDATTRTRANRIRLELSADRGQAEGSVEATHIGGDLQSALPINILADRVTGNRHDQVVRYEGNVRAWHGADVIETPALDVDRRDQQVRAGPSVVSSYTETTGKIAGGPESPAAGLDSGPLTIRADYLDYFGQQAKATYRGGVMLKSQNTALRSDRLDVYLTPSKTIEGSQVERAVAEGHVEITQPGRRATGERAEYEAKTGKIVMTGGPPTLYDSANGVTIGRRLTFFTLDDTLLVDGGYNSTSLPKQHVAQ